MKALFSILILGLAVIGCGKIESGASSSGGTGAVRSFASAPASAAQLNAVQTLCSKLQVKQTNLQYYANGVSRFNYDTSYKACDGSVQTSSVVALLNFNGSVLNYVVQSGSFFATQVETATTGQISQLCSAGTNLGYPHETSATMAIWYNVYTGGDCPSGDPDVQCVLMETGFKQPSGGYLVTSVNRFVLDFSPGQESGMVIRHERFDTAGCAVNKNTSVTAVFRGIN